MEPHATERRCTIYQGRGSIEVPLEPPPAAEGTGEGTPYHAPVADRVAIHTIMGPAVICVEADVHVDTIIDILRTRTIGCVPVVDGERRPIGIITKHDLLVPIGTTADDVMTPYALAVDEDTTIARAAQLMVDRTIHHVLVVSGERLIGIVTALDIVRWVTEHDVLAVRRDASVGPPVWRPYDVE